MRRPLLRTGVAGACFLGAALLAVPAQAEGEPGDAFFGYNLTAEAHGFQMTEDRPSANSHPEADTEVPHTAVSLSAGPVGFGLSSVAWPGALAGNAGTLLLLANPNAPQEVKALNSPVRAEARTGSAQNDVTNDSVPGARMHAKALADSVTADTVVNGGAAGDTIGFGKTTSVSTVTLGTATGSSVADSTAKDLSFAAGVVAVESVTSHAEAISDGFTASAKGITQVTGMTVAGVPVTVDERGVTVNGTSAADPIATEVVNTALANLGMTIALSKPSKDISGGSARYDAGSLIVNWAPPGAGITFTASVGGARVLASANPGSASPVTDPVVVPPVVVPEPGQPAVPPPAVFTPVDGGLVVAPVTPEVPQPGPAPTTVPQAIASSEERPLLFGSSIPLTAALLTGLGALALLSGLVRVPVLLFKGPPPVRCPLEDTP